MIPGRELVRLLAAHEPELAVTPLIDADTQIGEASIDLRLGPDIIVSRRATGATAFDAADPVRFRRAVQARQQYVRRGFGDSFHLQPGEFVIARSLEFITVPPRISAEALGRSSLGRLGLVIATATMIQPGFKGTITLELTNVANTPLVLQVGLRIAQLVFRRDTPLRRTPSLRGLPSPPGSEARRRRGLADRWWGLRPPKLSRYHGQIKPQLSKLETEADLRWIAPLSLRYVVGIVGERYSGKSTILNFLVARRRFRLYRLSQFVYEEAHRLGLDASDREEMRKVGNQLRAEHGRDVLARMAFHRIRSDLLDPDRERNPEPVIIAGFRTEEELAAWQELSAFRTMIVTADPARRLKRARSVGFHNANDIYESHPGENAEEDEWLSWFSRNVDEPVGTAILEQAASGAPLRIANNYDGVGPLHRDLALQVRRLERWWRAQIV